MTKQQKAVYDIVTQSQEHLTADQVYLLSKQRVANISIGTVYRNLNQLAKDRKVRRVCIPNSPDYYDCNIFAHDHLICEHCGAIKDFKIPELKRFIECQINMPVLSFDLNVRYICPECQAKEANAELPWQLSQAIKERENDEDR